MRQSGILLHPTSLPESAGIGTLGKQAYKFIDWLEMAGQSLWQILPIGPTGYGDSPYASFSTFAGNQLLIDLDDLAEKGYCTKEQILEPNYINRTGYIDYGAVVYWKNPLLKLIANQFLENANETDKQKFSEFKLENEEWLTNYATFMSIKEIYDEKAKKQNQFGAMWANFWPKNLAAHKKQAVEKWQKEHETEIEQIKAIQFFFFSQWKALKKYANDKGIQIIGDIPIFVAYDSADVWANQKQFQLDSDCKPINVAGVPPDYFSATGQLWGNPLYDWDKMKKDGYKWWIWRIKAMLNLVDYIRIDHFRGFEAYWAIPYGSENAINGKWIKGPDHFLFDAIKKELGQIPIIAEDLGIITDEVKKLRDDFGLSGMKVLQFAFDISEEKNGKLKNAFLPHEYGQNFIVYTGTHDNETMKGYLDNASDEEKALIKKYLTGDVSEIELTNETTVKLLIKEAFKSAAKMAIIPLQDVYGIGSNGRMNTPSTVNGRNWQWRMTSDMFDEKKAEWLKNLSMLYDRN